jgi:threonine dehydratase
VAERLTITAADVAAARQRIAGAVAVSPCVESEALSQLTGCRIVCKLDNLQRTGSFKERGGRNALMLLDPAARGRGVIAASAGNHALALACHGRDLNVPVTVVMPRFAPLTKVSRCRGYGAEVVLHGDDFAAARTRADELAAERGLTYVHGYDAPAIIAGQGTVGLELMEQAPDLDAVIVPVGGGGLIAGVALAIRAVKPGVEIIGVEPAHAAGFTAAVAAGRPVRIDCRPTLADGLAVGLVGELAFRTAAGLVGRVVTVEESAIALAVVRLMELEKTVVEGAAAAALAALLGGALDDLHGKRVALLLSGGNIDLTVLGRIIEHGLVADGRLCRFAVIISDRPGGLAALARLIAEAGASIHDIVHDRAFAGPDVTSVRVVCLIETSDHSHAAELRRRMTDAGYCLEQT